MRKHQYAWCHRNDSHNSPFIAGMKLVFSQNLTEKQRESKSVCVCVLSCVCVYICGPLQLSLGDGDRLPWQRLECDLQ